MKISSEAKTAALTDIRSSVSVNQKRTLSAESHVLLTYDNYNVTSNYLNTKEVDELNKLLEL